MKSLSAHQGEFKGQMIDGGNQGLSILLMNDLWLVKS